MVPVETGTAIIFNDGFIHSSGLNASTQVRSSVDLRYQPSDRDPMLQHGIGFLARSRAHLGRVASPDDWRAGRMKTALTVSSPTRDDRLSVPSSGAKALMRLIASEAPRVVVFGVTGSLNSGRDDPGPGI